ncbi:MAG: ferritin-like domain-containing protein [Gemmatimonadaceae bacterium]
MAEEVNPATNYGLVAAGALGVLTLAACGAQPTNPAFAKSLILLPLENDSDIMRFALLLALLEVDFYTKAVASGVLSGNVATLAASIRTHKISHVSTLQSALGTNAITTDQIAFNFGAALISQASFLTTAQSLKQTSVGAYLGVAHSIASRSVRTTLGSIGTVEARHYAALRIFNNASGGPVPVAFETPLTPQAVVNALTTTSFITKGLV